MKFVFAAAVLVFTSACASKSVYEPVTDREGIKHVVREHFGELEHCYLRAIDARPGAEGKVVMSWEITPDGHVANAKVQEASQKIEAIGPCLVKKIQKWSFPKLSEEEVSVAVTYPFFFSENGDFKDPAATSVTK